MLTPLLFTKYCQKIKFRTTLSTLCQGKLQNYFCASLLRNMNIAEKCLVTVECNFITFCLPGTLAVVVSLMTGICSSSDFCLHSRQHLSRLSLTSLSEVFLLDKI